MSELRCGAWAVAAVALLFDVAPSPSCGSGARGETGFLYVSAGDCSCAAGAISVSIDGRVAAQIACGGEGGTAVELRGGSHVLTATSGPVSWPPQSHAVSPGRTTRVDLGCPSPSR